MNIVKEELGGGSALLRVKVAEADYNEAVEKTLKEYKRKANVPGFRPGMVPMGIVNKMYRKGVVAEEAYKKASNACFEYIETQGIATVGDLIPSDKQLPLDFDNDTEHEFVFEYGEAPEVNIALGAKDKVPYYKIKVSKDMREGYRANFLRKFGRLVDVEKVEKDEALNVTLDNADMHIEEAYVGLISMEEKARAPFIGKVAGDTMPVNVNELYPSESQRASILGVKEEELAGVSPHFNLTITKIRKFAEPEMNEEFFKMAFPEGDVKNAKEFDTFIDGQIEGELDRESGYLFALQLRKFLLEKANLTLPEAFLRRWLVVINENRFSEEEINRDFPPFVEIMKWNLIQRHYIRTLNLDVTEEELVNEAMNMTRAQFAQYGMGQLPDEMVKNYSQSILQNKDEVKKLYDKIFERKVIDWAAPQVTKAEKSVSAEEFGKVVEEVNS